MKLSKAPIEFGDNGFIKKIELTEDNDQPVKIGLSCDNFTLKPFVKTDWGKPRLEFELTAADKDNLEKLHQEVLKLMQAKLGNSHWKLFVPYYKDGIRIGWPMSKSGPLLVDIVTPPGTPFSSFGLDLWNMGQDQSGGASVNMHKPKEMFVKVGVWGKRNGEGYPEFGYYFTLDTIKN